jgi:hypothetical protein
MSPGLREVWTFSTSDSFIVLYSTPVYYFFKKNITAEYIMDGRHKLMEGIVTGIPRGMKKPMIDGIVSGLSYSKHDASVKESLHTVKPSATQFSPGVFGAGRTIEGKGDGKGSSSMKPSREEKMSMRKGMKGMY